MVVGAVVLGEENIEGLDDSKKLTKKKREFLENEIYQKAKSTGLGWVSASELDEAGMSKALELATIRAVKQIDCSYNEIIIDGTVNFLRNTQKGKYVRTMAKADSLFSCVSAASIIAKVGRDRYMNELGKKYPEYGFESNAGYGTKKHIEAIEKIGIIHEHRISFKPLSKYSEISLSLRNKFEEEKVKTSDNSKNTKSVGDRAETVVADFLIGKGYKIAFRNWKNKYCEIDIVAVKDKELYFVEVKYRNKNNWGDGLDAITAKKLKQMKFASSIFLENETDFMDYQPKLMAISVSGDKYDIGDVVEIEN